MTEKTCPKCGFTGDIATYFGYRYKHRADIVQSHCKACRKRQSSQNDLTVDFYAAPELTKVEIKQRYQELFPNDKQSRSARTMLKRIKARELRG